MTSEQIIVMRAETVRKEIDGYRTEINTRVQLRDTALFGYLAGAGVLFGTALEKSGAQILLLVIPFLGLSISLIVAQHHIVIGRREAVIAHVLRPALHDLDAGIPARPDALSDLGRAELNMRSLAHAVTLFIPMIFSLALTTSLVFGEADVGVVWGLSAAAAIASVFVTWRSHAIRTHLRKPQPKSEARSARHGTTEETRASDPSRPPVEH